jgi:hypothetical protein
VTGLICVRNRWLDPRTGTFLTPDPLAYRDSSNLYSFAAGDPINRRDPQGLAGEDSLARGLKHMVDEMQAYEEHCTDHPEDAKCISDFERWLVRTFGDKRAETIRVGNNHYGRPPIIYVNGINTSKERAIDTGQRISAIFRRPIIVVWNPTAITSNVLTETAANVIQTVMVNKTNARDASTLFLIRAIRDVARSHDEVMLLAHSQGAAIASSALSRLRVNERSE